MKKKKILIVGAGFLQSFVIKKAKEIGYITLAVDANPNAVGFEFADKYRVINIVDEQSCLEYAMEENIDGVLTAATDYGVLTAAYISEKMNLPGISYKVAQLAKNKYQVRKCLFENNVDDTEEAYEIDKCTDLDRLKDSITYPVMVKPCDGSGSRGTSRVNGPDELAEACKFAMDSSITHRAEIEKFIIGEEYGAETLVTNGKVHVLSIMKKWMTEPPYYAELGHAIPSGLPVEIENRATKCVEEAIKALGIESGSVNMDMIITTQGSVHIVDIGARMGGNMIGPCIIPYGTGFDYVENMIRNAVGDEVVFYKKKHKAVATKLIAFGHDGIVKKMPDFEKLEQEYDVEIYHHLALNDVVNVYHTNLDGCGYIIAKRNTADEAATVAKEVLKRIDNLLF